MLRPRPVILLLNLILSTMTAVSQTEAGTAIPPKKSPLAVSKAIPIIKCTDPDSMAACMSFKQLVDARDQGVLFGLMGSPEDAGRHIAYVCPRRGSDTFTEVAFAVPDKKQFKPFASTSDEKLRRVLAGAWLGNDPSHPLSSSAISRWYEDHRDGLLFAPGVIGVTSYQDGQLADLKVDNGEWSQPTGAARNAHDDGYAEYGGYHYWIQAYNEIYANESPEADDPKNMHLHIDGGAIYAHYSFENNNGDTTDYVLQIHRSTGRFTETFKHLGDRDDDAGTCMIFKY
jgi:hypothetical protein